MKRQVIISWLKRDYPDLYQELYAPLNDRFRVSEDSPRERSERLLKLSLLLPDPNDPSSVAAEEGHS